MGVGKRKGKRHEESEERSETRQQDAQVHQRRGCPGAGQRRVVTQHACTGALLRNVAPESMIDKKLVKLQIQEVGAAARGRGYCDILRQYDSHFPTIMGYTGTSVQPPSQQQQNRAHLIEETDEHVASVQATNQQQQQQQNRAYLFEETDEQLIEMLMDEIVCSEQLIEMLVDERGCNPLLKVKQHYLAELLRIEQLQLVGHIMDKDAVKQIKLRCPRCFSWNTRFDYLNNKSNTQKRYMCNVCDRQWTAGGKLKDIPEGSKKRKSSKGTKKSREKKVPKNQEIVNNERIKGTKKSSEKKAPADQGIVINEAQAQLMQLESQQFTDGRTKAKSKTIGDFNGLASLSNCIELSPVLKPPSGGYCSGDPNGASSSKCTELLPGCAGSNGRISFYEDNMASSSQVTSTDNYMATSSSEGTSSQNYLASSSEGPSNQNYTACNENDMGSSSEVYFNENMVIFNEDNVANQMLWNNLPYPEQNNHLFYGGNSEPIPNLDNIDLDLDTLDVANFIQDEPDTEPFYQ